MRGLGFLTNVLNNVRVRYVVNAYVHIVGDEIVNSMLVMLVDVWYDYSDDMVVDVDLPNCQRTTADDGQKM